MTAYMARRREETIAIAFALNDPSKIDDVYPPAKVQSTATEKWWG